MDNNSCSGLVVLVVLVEIVHTRNGKYIAVLRVNREEQWKARNMTGAGMFATLLAVVTFSVITLHQMLHLYCLHFINS